MKVLSRFTQDGIQNRVQDVLDTLKKYGVHMDIDDYGFIQSNLASIVKMTHSKDEYLEWLQKQVEKAFEK